MSIDELFRITSNYRRRQHLPSIPYDAFVDTLMTLTSLGIIIVDSGMVRLTKPNTCAKVEV